MSGNESDVYVAHRPTLDARFEPAVAVPGLATPGVIEQAPDVLPNGDGYMSRGAGDVDLWQLDRTAGVFTLVRALTELNDPRPQYNPFITADDLSLWFTTTTTAGDQDIMTTTRATPTDPWPAPIAFVHDTAGPDGSPSLTADGRVIVWNTLSMPGVGDIYYAVRASPEEPWGPAQVLGAGTVSDASTIELTPYVREDGCELFFGRVVGSTNWDVYSVAIE